MLRPEEIDLDPALGDSDRGVEERGRVVAREDERQDLRLQRALEAALLGEWRRAAPFLDQGSQAAVAKASRIHRRLDRRDVEVFLLRRPLEAAAQRPVSNRAREVDERPRRAGAGDTRHGADLVGSQGSHAMKADAVDLPPPSPGGDDVDHNRSSVE